MRFKSDKQRKAVMSQYKRGKDYVPVGRDRSLPNDDRMDNYLLSQIRGIKQGLRNRDEFLKEQRKELTEKQLKFLRFQRKPKVVKCRKCGSEIIKGTSRCTKCGLV